MAEFEATVSAAPPRSILVRSVNWLGDAVMTTPALGRLRLRFPDSRISILTREKLSGLWQEQLLVDGVLNITRDESPWSVGRRLRSENFDLALLFPNSLRSALEAWWARIPARVGYGGSWRGLLLTQSVARPIGHVETRKRSTSEVHRRLRAGKGRQTWPSSAHQVHEYLRLVQAVGASPEVLPPTLSVTGDNVRAVVEKFALAGPLPGARPLFGLNPGAEYGPAKRWPAERFAETALEVHQRTQCVWLLTGSAADAATASFIERKLRESGALLINAAGKTTLRELCALLKLCRVLLTNDTGPMHVAAALGVPVVVPFGSTSPELTGPGLPGDPRHRLLSAPEVGCAPCFRRTCPVDLQCMKALSASQVTAAILAAATAPR